MCDFFTRMHFPQIQLQTIHKYIIFEAIKKSNCVPLSDLILKFQKASWNHAATLQ